ncbi:MAG: hypothetical protein SWX82_15455 [Cyanobacteriota bacterium]|nr:hypothetical protein [Cyanobacteriota bacterium]
MKIQPEDRPQTVQEWLALLQLQPQSIISQMSQVSQAIIPQQDLRRGTTSSEGECHSPLQVAYNFVFCVSPAQISILHIQS